MGFSSLGLKLSIFASKLMGISSPAINTSNIKASSNALNQSAFETIFLLIGNTIKDVGIYVIESVYKIIYAIVRWILVSIDFIFIFIRQMVGMNTDFSNLDSLAESDMIFQFVFNENVLRIMKAMIGFAIILLVLFCIFAIVKSEYDFIANGGKDGNSKKSIIVNTLKSLFLMAFVPLVAIGGIFMSNAILCAIYNATSGGSDVSMGSKIFLASTYDANAYRLYANRNLKRPITFNFSKITQEDSVYEYYTDGTVAEAEEALNSFKNQSAFERGLKTYLMFANESFLSMDDVDRLDRVYGQNNDVSPYHSVYDTNLYSRKEQYYIMADVLDYTISRNRAVYFKTMEDVYESYFEVYNKVSEDVKKQMIFTDSGNFPIIRENDKYYSNATYIGDNEPTAFTHIKGRKDEAKEAVFIIALEKTVEYGGKTYSYYYPLLNAKDNFATDYYQGKENIVIAKGLFYQGENPTAIREKDGVIEFYRDEINIPVLIDLFPKISYELPESATELVTTKLLKAGFSAITGVDLTQFIPYIYYNIDIFHLFTKQQYAVAKLDGGYFKVDYNFSYKSIDKSNVYAIREINPVILIMASGLLITILFKLLLGIAFRTLDLFMLILTYPAVLASMPLSGGGSFKNWTETFIKKLLSIYGVVVGINVVLIVTPVMDQIDFFTTSDIQSAINLGEIGAGMTAGALNFLIRIFFVLVALSSIKPFMVAISKMLGFVDVTELSKDDKKAGKSEEVVILKEGDEVISGISNTFKTAGSVISGKYFMDKANEVYDLATKVALPGKAIIHEGAASIQDVVQKGKKFKDKISGQDNMMAKISRDPTQRIADEATSAPVTKGVARATGSSEYREEDKRRDVDSLENNIKANEEIIKAGLNIDNKGDQDKKPEDSETPNVPENTANAGANGNGTNAGGAGNGASAGANAGGAGASGANAGGAGATGSSAGGAGASGSSAGGSSGGSSIPVKMIVDDVIDLANTAKGNNDKDNNDDQGEGNDNLENIENIVNKNSGKGSDGEDSVPKDNGANPSEIKPEDKSEDTKKEETDDSEEEEETVDSEKEEKTPKEDNSENDIKEENLSEEDFNNNFEQKDNVDEQKDNVDEQKDKKDLSEDKNEGKESSDNNDQDGDSKDADKNNESFEEGEIDPRNPEQVKSNKKKSKEKKKQEKEKRKSEKKEKSEKDTSTDKKGKSKQKKKAKEKAPKKTKEEIMNEKAMKQAKKQTAKEKRSADRKAKWQKSNHTGLKILAGVGKTTGKFALTLTKIAGKTALGLTKTALKMSTRVVKTTASSLWKFASGEQGIGKTLAQISGGVFVAGIKGVGGITKTGLTLGKDLTVASAKTAGGLVKSFGGPILQGIAFKKRKAKEDKEEAEKEETEDNSEE